MTPLEEQMLADLQEALDGAAVPAELTAELVRLYGEDKLAAVETVVEVFQRTSTEADNATD